MHCNTIQSTSTPAASGRPFGSSDNCTNRSKHSCPANSGTAPVIIHSGRTQRSSRSSYKIIVYGISGLFCAVASIVFVARIDSITSNAGTNYETNALAAAIIGGVTFDGGKGTISGAFLGCLLMGVISNAMNILGVDNNVQTIITGAIIVAAVVLSNINNIKKK